MSHAKSTHPGPAELRAKTEWDWPVSLADGTWRPAVSVKRPLSDIVPRDRQLLSAALGLSYDLRSGLVHRGEDLDLLKAGLAAGVQISDNAPIPYAVLRAIVVALIQFELFGRSRPTELPDIQS
jgi:hypothetical protein